MTTTLTPTHRLEQFDCFGSAATIRAEGPDDAVLPAVARARAVAFEMQRRLTCSDPASELSRLNADPRERVPASALLRRFVTVAVRAAEDSGGLVDAACLPAVDRPVHSILAGVRVEGRTIVRPPGLRLDSGVLGKGLAADLMSRQLADLDAWVVDCGSDLRVGGSLERERTIHVLDPIDQDVVLHALALTQGAVATSGITGRPADTAVLQVTAVAPTGVDAAILAKTAILAGPDRAAKTLRHGGAVVLADGRVEAVPTAVA